MRPPRNPQMDKLATLSALQNLDLGQTASDQQQQQLDQQAQDQAVRQAVEMYGIEHQKALLPGQVAGQDLANQQGQFHLAWAQPNEEQQYRQREGDMAAQPVKNAYIGSETRQNAAKTAEMQAMLAAGEPAARVGSQNAQAEALRSGPLMQYYTAGMPFPNGPKPPSGFIESQLAKLMPNGMPIEDPRIAELTAKNTELAHLIPGQGEKEPAPEHPLASMAMKGVTPDYPWVNQSLGQLAGAPFGLWAQLQNMYGEDAYNNIGGDNMDLGGLLLSKSAKTRRQAEKDKIKQQAKQTTPAAPHPATAFNS